MSSKIGFIGLGTMAKPIAANIASAGFDLTVYDLREEPCRELASLGAKAAGSAREVAEHSDIVEIVVVDDDQSGTGCCRGARGDSWRATGFNCCDS